MLGYSFRHDPFSLSSFSLLPFSFLLSPFSFVLSPFSFLRHARDSLATIHDVSTVRARPIRSKVIRFWVHLTTRRREDSSCSFGAEVSWRRHRVGGIRQPSDRAAPHCAVHPNVCSLSTRVTAATAPCCCSCPEPTVARLGAVPLTARGPLPASRPI